MKYSVALCVGAIVVGCATGCSGLQTVLRDTSAVNAAPPSTDADRTVANYFHVGDCFRDPVQAGGAPVTLVDCAQPHVGQVYAIFMLPDGPFPGNDSSAYRKQCGGAARALPNGQQLNEDPTLRTIFRFPDAHSWAIGDRSLTCILSSSTPRRGSDIDAG